MPKVLACFWIIFLSVTSIAAPYVAGTHVAVLETVSEQGVIGRSEKMFLTDKLRERANKVLPAYMGYVVMTRENISAMLPPGKSIEDCEGSCLVETGKNIAADYVAQARVGKFGKQPTLTMELYETAGSNLVGSFTTRKPDAEGLLEELEREADRVFQLIIGTSAPAVKKTEEISVVSTSNMGYQAGGGKLYIVNVESKPAGVLFSVDGRVNSSCNTTPCEIALPAGNHLFSFNKEMFQDKDVPVDVQKSGQKVSVKLDPYFGKLTIDPVFEGGMGKLEEAVVTIDGKKIKQRAVQLSVGSHKVQITHKCYEDVVLDLNVKNRSIIRFDQKMQPLLGGLQMDAMHEGKPKSVPVYVNGKMMGNTPFLEMIPVCSKVQIGKDKKKVPVKLKAGETVRYVHTINESVGMFVDRRDGKKYTTAKIGRQTWMAENLRYETASSYCYAEERANCAQYGKLYTWEDAKRACPLGWHLPSEAEWGTLFYAVGGASVAGAILKSKEGWIKGGVGKDIFLFSALPAGYRNEEGDYDLEGGFANFWSSTERDSRNAYFMSFYFDRTDVKSGSNKKDYAFSVRCVKD